MSDKHLRRDTLIREFARGFNGKWRERNSHSRKMLNKVLNENPIPAEAIARLTEVQQGRLYASLMKKAERPKARTHAAQPRTRDERQHGAGERYDFRCEQCGDYVPLRDPVLIAALMALFDRLEDRGESVVPLSALRLLRA